MGGIANELADFVIVTDDNPRNEKAENIRAEILTYCDKTKTVEINNRKTAIETALTMLRQNDILILAGKGHEKYQIIGTTKFEFDEEK
jgi:UDP-N-acetylmuramoyl-L-alanyl-D-glutamate--2,6-diaminopimelate ligase